MIERTYNVPLRTGFRNTARYKKTKKAVTTLREFLVRHMKSEKILIGENLNKFLWKDGIKNPPHHVKITVIKEDDGTVKAELHGMKYEHQTKAEKEKAAEKKKKAEEKKADVKKPKENTPKELPVEEKNETDAAVEETPKPKKKAAPKKAE